MSLGVFNSAAFLTAGQLVVAGGATVEVRRESDSGLASIFSDRAGTAAITNPSAFADASGRFDFYTAASPGGFSILVTSGAESFTLNNIPIGTAQEMDVDPFWATVLPAATAAAARLALGIGAATHGGFSVLNGYLDWTVAGNALTVAVKTWAGTDPSATDPVYIAFRDPTAATGLPLIRTLTAATSVAASSGSTLGTINATAFRLWCVAFDDAGTVRLGLINCLSGTAPSFSIYPLAGWAIASSTAEGGAGAADSAAVFYTGTAVAAKAYATLGYATWEAGLAAAGTWSAAPTRKQLFGLGVPLPGQTIQVQRTATGAVASGATVIPFDDTIPQSNEGNEYMTVGITPTSAADLLHIESQLWLNQNTAAANNVTAALFQDAVANALVAIQESIDRQNAGSMVQLNHWKRAGSSSAITFKARAGPQSAATITFNGVAAGRSFGGVANSYLQVQEIMA